MLFPSALNDFELNSITHRFFPGKTDHDRVVYWNEYKKYFVGEKKIFISHNCATLNSFRFIDSDLKVMEGFWIESFLLSLDCQCYLCECRKIKNTFTPNSNFYVTFFILFVIATIPLLSHFLWNLKYTLSLLEVTLIAIFH